MSGSVGAVRAQSPIESVRSLPLRWLAVGIFTISNILNFLDRQALAALAPTLLGDFHLSNVQYGALISAFSLTYAIAAPMTGMLVDRFGLNLGAAGAVGLWSFAGMCNGFVQSFRGLLICRSMLGLGEAAGLPFLAKATAAYLPAAEWGLANAVGSIAVTLGSASAPLLAAAISPKFGWRSVFVASGALGFLWVTAWLLTARRIPPPHKALERSQVPIRHLLLDRRLWRVIAAYPLVMAVFILWLNWTTLYLVKNYSLSEADANRYFAWIPAVCATLGGFTNGWMTYRWIRGGVNSLVARIRMTVVVVPLFLIAAATPLMPSARLAIAAIGIGLFATQGVISSLNVIPIDLFGPGRAAFSISLLACSYALMQTFVAPLIGKMVDTFGFSAVCVGVSVLAMVGIWIIGDLRKANLSLADGRCAYGS